MRTARKGLAKQMAGLMMSQWHQATPPHLLFTHLLCTLYVHTFYSHPQHRHICENYNPHKTADTSHGDCSGTKFYHWGALNGVIGLMEDGLF